jgi:hypothetical protein
LILHYKQKENIRRAKEEEKRQHKTQRESGQNKNQREYIRIARKGEGGIRVTQKLEGYKGSISFREMLQ